MKRIILFGAPGAGKGSVADCLVNEFAFIKISTGDLIRAEIKAQSQIGKQVQQIIETGSLAPDSIIIEMVRQRVARPDVSNGYIMDGFPRTLAQAQALSTIPVISEKAVLLQVDEDEVVARLLSRLTCLKCGAIYNTRNNPPKVADICDKCGGVAGRRADDNETTIRQRMTVYMQETMPVIDFYEKQGILSRIDGTGSYAEVVDRIRLVVA